jgi:hypothetical protein
MDSESTIGRKAKPNLSQLHLSRLSSAKPDKLNFLKTPASREQLIVHYSETTLLVKKYLGDGAVQNDKVSVLDEGVGGRYIGVLEEHSSKTIHLCVYIYE